jgi:hypothetical protein
MTQQAHQGKVRTDRIAQRMTRGRSPGYSTASPLRRAAAITSLQRAAGNEAVSDLLAAGEGAALPAALRHDMEERFGHDFGTVRIHDTPSAADAAEGMSANAFTVGPHIAFARGRFAPDTRDGKRLIAHELAHVVQQSRGGPPPSLDPASPLEQSAEAASETAAAGDGPVAVGGASSPGIARDIFDVQAALDRRMAAEKGTGVPLDTRRLPSFNSPGHEAIVGKAPTFAQIMQRAAERRRLDELKSSRGQQPQPTPAPPPPPTPVPAPAQPAAKPDNNDPQPTTATGLGYQGASNLGQGQSNVTLGAGYSPLAGGVTSSLQLATGLHDFSKLDTGLAAVVSGSRDPSGNLGFSAYANPYWSPKNYRLNLGVYGGLAATGGQRPPGDTGASYGPSGILAGEALIGGPSRDQPRLTLGGNLGLTWQDRARIAAAGIGGATTPTTYLKDATILSATGSAQLNLDYYRAGAGADSELSKTPRYTLTAEGTYGRTSGTPYSDATTPAVPGSSTSYALGAGALRNWRLGSGHTVLSAGLFGGYRREDDTIGKTTYSSGRPYGAAVIGGSFW